MSKSILIYNREIDKKDQQGLIKKTSELVEAIIVDGSKPPTTFLKSYKQSPSLRQLKRFNPKVIQTAVVPFIMKFCKGLDVDEIKILVQHIASDCINWNINDFNNCFTNGIKKKYGKIYSKHPTLTDLIGWMNRYYSDEMFDGMQQLKHNKRFEPLINPNAVDNPMSKEERSRQLQKHKAIGLTKKGLSDGTYSKNTVDVTGVNAEIKRHSEDGNEEHEQIKGGANIYLDNLMKEIDEKSKK